MLDTTAMWYALDCPNPFSWRVRLYFWLARYVR